MPKVNPQYSKSSYQEIIFAIKKRIKRCEDLLSIFVQRNFNGIREEVLIYCLNHAIDLAKGCVTTAEECLSDSTATLDRALLETLFWTRYVSISEKNAQEFSDATKNELKRIARMNISSGYARIYKIDTNEDKTAELINSDLLNNISNRIRLKAAAEAGGLEKIYTMVYGFMSMTAHGRAYNLDNSSDCLENVYISLCSVLGSLQSIEVITEDWIKWRKISPQETLNRIFGV